MPSETSGPDARRCTTDARGTVDVREAVDVPGAVDAPAAPPSGARARRGRHGAPRTPFAAVSVERARRRLATALVGAGAITATLLTASVSPAAPPAPDREPGAASSDVAQLSGDRWTGQRPSP
ncbi:hypothetical protein ACIQCR_04870 [Streptomyces sp. NPDC093249]|uniref:hypothetical protein n=1 Tax=unclassified Streptomyces TaxID=2593676 RepID=UPI00382546AB